MQRISVTLQVDESSIMKACEGTGASTLNEAITQELSWLHDSGIFVENWSYADPEQERTQQLIDSLLGYLGEHHDSSELYGMFHYELGMSHDDIALLGFDLPQCYAEEHLNTKISYLYRDADNYKAYNEAVVAGTLTESQKKAIMDSLHDGEYFIPHQVGLPEKRFDDGWTDSDHCWFELDEESFEPTTLAPTVSLSAAELSAAFSARKERWDDAILPLENQRPVQMDLHQFLSYFDFDYDIVQPGGKYENRIRQELMEDGVLSPSDADKALICLIDLQGAYYGDIGKMRYPIELSSVAKIMDRMDIYIQESVIDEFTSALGDRGINTSTLALGEMIYLCRTLGVGEGEVCYELAEAVNHPESVSIQELEPQKNALKVPLIQLIQNAEKTAAAVHPDISQREKESPDKHR